MIEAFGNIWDHIDEYDAIVITTNGVVKKSGEAVMGRGIALEAAQRYIEFPWELGRHLLRNGNTVGYFEFDEHIFLTLPVKPAVGPNGVPGWRAKADIGLIKYSLIDLINAVNSNNFERVLMPRPGCGNGGLNWESVREEIKDILDIRFTVMEKR